MCVQYAQTHPDEGKTQSLPRVQNRRTCTCINCVAFLFLTNIILCLGMGSDNKINDHQNSSNVLDASYFLLFVTTLPRDCFPISQMRKVRQEPELESALLPRADITPEL